MLSCSFDTGCVFLEAGSRPFTLDTDLGTNIQEGGVKSLGVPCVDVSVSCCMFVYIHLVHELCPTDLLEKLRTFNLTLMGYMPFVSKFIKQSMLIKKSMFTNESMFVPSLC